jgi:hypothetical protein
VGFGWSSGMLVLLCVHKFWFSGLVVMELVWGRARSFMVWLKMVREWFIMKANFSYSLLPLEKC